MTLNASREPRATGGTVICAFSFWSDASGTTLIMFFAAESLRRLAWEPDRQIGELREFRKAVFSVLNAVLLKVLPVREPARLVQLEEIYKATHSTFSPIQPISACPTGTRPSPAFSAGPFGAPTARPTRGRETLRPRIADLADDRRPPRAIFGAALDSKNIVFHARKILGAMS